MEETLPWDFINVGLDKTWLVNEYKQAFEQGCEFNLQKTCEQGCVNCGVCKNLKTHKVLAEAFKASDEAQKVLTAEKIDPTRAHPNPDILSINILIGRNGIGAEYVSFEHKVIPSLIGRAVSEKFICVFNKRFVVV